MDITVDLPDDIRDKAKEAGIDLSRTLRDAVESELERTRAMKDLTAGTNHTERILELETPEGEPSKGVLLYENRKGDQVILTEDEKLIFYYRQQAKHFVREDEEDALRETLQDVCDEFDEYISVMARLEIKPDTVDL